MSNIAYSYKELINSFRNFKKVDKKGINRYDTPAALYFKPFFYFTDDYGLLGINNINFSEKSEFEETSKKWIFDDNFNGDNSDDIRSQIFPDTAFSYLCVNDELERVELLKRFILLLSEISTNSPWYFKSITGLDAALERKMFDKDFKIDEERKSITIECLEDAYDQRIGTLLDLYRAICYSYQSKREIIPANLRKFNMGVLLFNAPIRGFGGKSGDKQAEMTIPNSEVNHYISNTKLIELRNCEIDYNSGKTAYGTLTTEEPLSPKYTITIYFDDAYEARYNEVLQNVVSDFISIDIDTKRTDTTNTFGNTPTIKEMKLKPGLFDAKSYWNNSDFESDPYKVQIENSSNGLLGNAVNALETQATSSATGELKKLYLGNIYGVSISNIQDDIQNLKNGNITNMVGKVSQTTQKVVNKISDANISNKSIYEQTANTIFDNELSKNKLPQFSDKKVTELGKINSAKSIYNSL